MHNDRNKADGGDASSSNGSCNNFDAVSVQGFVHVLLTLRQLCDMGFIIPIL